jgi:8-oxo-dGTP pyrophosphatase MutT (NUDIX family)
MTAPVIHRVTTLDLRLEPWSWPFAIERRTDIDAYFAARQAEKPELWNGRVLLARRPVFSEARFSACYFETDFASLLAWRDWGFPGDGVFDVFGMGALRCSDGVFALGVMGSHTANAGLVYFPAGMPDPADISEGTVDMPGSVAREVREETGLDEQDYRATAYWDCVVSGKSIAMIRLLDVNMPAERLRVRIETALASQHQPELCRIHLVRDASDFTPAMPRFVTAFLERYFSTSHDRSSLSP